VSSVTELYIKLKTHSFFPRLTTFLTLTGKLRIFRKEKTRFGLVKYLSEIQNIQHRQAVTRLRMSAHRDCLLKLVGITRFSTKIDCVRFVT
jgi:hypothetical protein